jgi:hypothetical protein
MPKRRRQHCDCGNGKRPRKHLYLVLDDWEKGFSVHKLDALSLFDPDSDSDSDSDDSGGLRRLPDPPALRITEARHSPMLFAGLSRRIFVANKRPYSAQASGALVYDTETAAMSLGPRLPENPCCLFVAADAAAAAGDGEKKKKARREQETVLYTLSTVDHGGRSQHPSGHLLGVSVHALSAAGEEWSWEGVPAPFAPFDGNEETVIAYAVHPDGRTIFVSTRDRAWRGGGTYSFHTERREWRSHGEWKLPFRQEGYFERELDAWVGLDEDGYVCACQTACQAAAPEWKKTADKLFRKGDPERYMGATLTYMGNNAFCLVESVMQVDVSLRHAYGDGHGCALHLTVFGLKYSREGELQATLRRATTSYAVCKYITGFSHVPLWM